MFRDSLLAQALELIAALLEVGLVDRLDRGTSLLVIELMALCIECSEEREFRAIGAGYSLP